MDEAIHVDLSEDSAHVLLRSAAHAETTSACVVYVLPVGDETRDVVGGTGHGLRADHDLTGILSFVQELRLPGLTGGTHERAHGDFYLTNKIVLSASIIVNIDHLKLELLLALKVVRHGEAGLEIGVEVVHDDLRLADLLPAVALLLKEDAPGVRLAEVVEVLELASRDEKVDALVQARVRLLDHFKSFFPLKI